MILEAPGFVLITDVSPHAPVRAPEMQNLTHFVPLWPGLWLGAAALGYLHPFIGQTKAMCPVPRARTPLMETLCVCLVIKLGSAASPVCCYHRKDLSGETSIFRCLFKPQCEPNVSLSCVGASRKGSLAVCAPGRLRS